MTPRRSARRLATAALGAGLLLVGCGVGGKPAAGTTSEPKTGTTARPQTTGSTAATPTSPLPGAWTRTVDPPSGVSFELPKRPTLFSPPVTAPDGARVTVRGYRVIVNPNLLVQVSVYDLAGRSFDADKAIDGVAATSHGRVISRNHTPSGGLDIVDARIRIPIGPAIGFDRVFKIGDHAVQLWTLGLASDQAQVRSVQQRLSSSFRR